MRVTLKTINDELAKRGTRAQLAKTDSYFYFHDGEAEDWLDKTIEAKTLSTFTLEEWIAQFERLQKLNKQILGVKPATRKKR